MAAPASAISARDVEHLPCTKHHAVHAEIEREALTGRLMGSQLSYPAEQSFSMCFLNTYYVPFMEDREMHSKSIIPTLMLTANRGVNTGM